MSKNALEIVGENLEKEKLIHWLEAEGGERQELFRQAAKIKLANVGNKVYFRGLIEMSNICSKNCFYCGIRKANTNVERYSLTDEQVLEAAKLAYNNKYGSLVIQSGEIASEKFTARIEKLLQQIKKETGNGLGITLSCGEQSDETYIRWFEAGAHRYLLRIEASEKVLYKKLHPNDGNHFFQYRLDCLKSLQNIGYQVGTGVMIGLPFQTTANLAGDLLFMKNFDIDMVGMGPYILHHQTPLWEEREKVFSEKKRFDLTLKMIALLRIMMPDINIAATTAMQTLDKAGREKAIMAGANVIMPNITPGCYRDNYILYENKPCTNENPEDCFTCLEARIELTGHKIGLGEWGDPKHFFNRL